MNKYAVALLFVLSFMTGVGVSFYYVYTHPVCQIMFFTPKKSNEYQPL